MRVSSGKSKLYHEGAIAERLLAAAAARVGGIRTGEAAADEDEAASAAGQLFVVRFHRDACTLSADASGELLHRRGYRVAVAKAPLRETLAAALLRASGWRPGHPLLDPFCGAGTIPIEAALIARRIPPGLASPDLQPRDFRALHWPAARTDLWELLVERARAHVRETASHPILASDRDAGAVEAALANARRAGVAADLEIEQKPLSAVEPPPGPGWLVTNPPYGLRVGEAPPLRNLYASLGRFARTRLPGWTIALLSADRQLDRQLRIPLTHALRTRNGGIEVRLGVGRVRNEE
jgi:putative N6-adenine-specific DNA methylase